jgi:hypothetical protein
VAGAVILADTVGFIRHLPHKLVQAFHATLEEVTLANLLLHVIDIAHPRWEDHVEQVGAVLAEIGADEVPQLWVLNKCDQLSTEAREQVQAHFHGKTCAWVSAVTGEGLDNLLALVGMSVSGDLMVGLVDIPPQFSRLRAALHEGRALVSESVLENGHWQTMILMPKQKWLALQREMRFDVEITGEGPVTVSADSPLQYLKYYNGLKCYDSFKHGSSPKPVGESTALELGLQEPLPASNMSASEFERDLEQPAQSDCAGTKLGYRAWQWQGEQIVLKIFSVRKSSD